MRESRTYGSVRGALSNERPYRDRRVRAHPGAPRITRRSAPFCPGYGLLQLAGEMRGHVKMTRIGDSSGI